MSLIVLSSPPPFTPLPSSHFTLFNSLCPSLQAESWRALEDLVDQGLIRALGVSNFDEHELRRLMDPQGTGGSLRHRPSVVQNKIDPYHIGKQLDNKVMVVVTVIIMRNLSVITVIIYHMYLSYVPICIISTL